MTPPCGYKFDGQACRDVGDHRCTLRGDHVVAFFQEILCHTKGRYAGKPFVLADWQEHGIVRPIFDTVVYTEDNNEYVRRYSVAYVELARKQGKSELLAAVALYLMIADGEESSELYGIARDKEQASLVFDVSARMSKLSPVLAKRLKVTPHNKRIIHENSNSVYTVISSDANGALGSNPSGVICDEILAWRDGSMWDAMRTGMVSDARKQPLMIAATTAGNSAVSFGGTLHAEMVRVQDDPSRAPHVFAYIRNTPKDADPYDEKNWYFANPALGDFLKLEAIRELAQEAKNDPTRENAFRQFHLNQHVQQTFRWMPMHLYAENVDPRWSTPAEGHAALAGQSCWLGMDLASRQDLTAWCLAFPDNDGGVDLLWRFWLPEGALENLDKRNEGRFSRWAAEGWLTTTDGEVVDYQRVYDDVRRDAENFEILGGDADAWSAAPVIQEIEATTYVDEIYAYKNDYTHMSPGMRIIMDLVKQGKFRHHGNPVASWCFDNVEARVAPFDPDIIRPDKPSRGATGIRIDAVPAAIMAINAWSTRGSQIRELIYDGLIVLD